MDRQNLYDMIIIGAGPSGLSAAIYMARAKYKVLVLEKEKIGGQITITEEIVNYPGVENTSGKALTESMRIQAESFGAKFAMAEVTEMDLKSDIKTLKTSKGEYQALSVVLAVGANPRKLGFKGEKEFQGQGVAYCATCDGEFFTGMNIFVVGGGFAAVEEGIFLTKYAKHVRLIVREEDFTCAKTVSDKLKDVENIDYVFNTEVLELTGENSMEKAVFINNQTGEKTEYSSEVDGPFGVFVFAGYVPNTRWLPDYIELDPQGYIITDRDQMTNVEGVYGAGDVCVKKLRQVVTAVADGAIAATSAEKHVSDMHAKLNIPEFEIELPKVEKKEETKASEQAHSSQFIDEKTYAGLKTVFDRFEKQVILKAHLDESSLSSEIKKFLEDISSMSDKISYEISQEQSVELLPSIEVCRADGASTGIHFHGVPGGHEINSFVIALYNVATSGQAIEENMVNRITSIKDKVNMKILVSLSCTMCPETVMSAQRIASLNDNVSAEMIDIAHFTHLKDKYKVMSVPCMVINDSKLVFGKKNISDVLNELGV